MSTRAGTLDPALERSVAAAIRSVDDPEYPGVSIVELGLLETTSVSAEGAVSVGLIPTFSGCPALSTIAADVGAAVRLVDGVRSVDVTWLPSPAWSVERVSAGARCRLASQFTVAVHIGGRSARCPLCDGELVELSMFGPSRCRSVQRCPRCSEIVEVLRS